MPLRAGLDGRAESIVHGPEIVPVRGHQRLGVRAGREGGARRREGAALVE